MKIPNICKNSGLLSVILYNQLIIIALFCVIEKEWKIEILGQYTFYLQWCVLGTMFIACLINDKINKLVRWQRIICFFIISISVFSIVELTSMQIMSSFFYDFEYNKTTFIRRFVAFSIFSILLIRLITLLGALEIRSQAESESKMVALQARIKPHFLFNSLNTISELVVSAPEHAESAINSLALLFRANLETNKQNHSLASELKLCERYIELESWRLGSKLSITWNNKVQDSTCWQVPKLLFQPLIENAVVHGKLDDGSVEISVDLQESNKHLSIKIKNKVNSAQQASKGNGIAIENIRERLFTLYDDQYKFRVTQNSDKYRVIMQIPKTKLVSDSIVS